MGLETEERTPAAACAPHLGCQHAARHVDTGNQEEAATKHRHATTSGWREEGRKQRSRSVTARLSSCHISRYQIKIRLIRGYRTPWQCLRPHRAPVYHQPPRARQPQARAPDHKQFAPRRGSLGAGRRRRRAHLPMRAVARRDAVTCRDARMRAAASGGRDGYYSHGMHARRRLAVSRTCTTHPHEDA